MTGTLSSMAACLNLQGNHFGTHVQNGHATLVRPACLQTRQAMVLCSNSRAQFSSSVWVCAGALFSSHAWRRKRWLHTLTVRDAERRHQLQLSFDVNKTIALLDTASGKSGWQLCNEALADSCWGSIVGNCWEWSGLPLSLQCPQGADNLITYSDWTNLLHRDVNILSEPLRQKDQARAAAAHAKTLRDAMRGRFAEASGDAPAEVAKQLPQLLDALALPADVRVAPGAAAAGLAGHETWFLLPSWLSAVRDFVESGDAERIGASLHLRTFGNDHAAVAHEFNAFACGQHPLHRGFRCDGSDGSVDRRIHLNGKGFGSYFRDAEGPVLALGADISRAKTRLHALSIAPAAGVAVALGVPAIHELLAASSAGGRTICLSDHWQHWRDSGEAAEAGKLLTVGDCHVLFVDDNVRRPDGHIVDVRDAASGTRIPWSKVEAEGYTETAWPCAALLHRSYFTSMIQRAVDKFNLWS